MGYYASYYKCALQVNPSTYASYRGESVIDESTYNDEILRKCKENNISVVGLANHGNVDSSESLRGLLSDNGIVVFPGFEIMSAEKIHMVCLFPEDRTISQLNRYLGAMGLDISETGNETSTFTCLQIAQKVKDEGGFWYAAHITSENGILKLGKLNTIWQNELLSAAQIPDSRENIDPNYKNIINNTDPQYKRAKPPAYINACDIDKPTDLDKESATTLIKMTEPSFPSFLMAFKDPESRIRLNSELKSGYQSAIRRMTVSGGYLDGLQIEFSDNLVTIIGGRGTGKSTIINLIRYALDLPIKDKNRRKEFEDMIDHNLGSAAKVELEVESNAQYGRTYTIIRRYKAAPVIQDSDGNVSSLKVTDIFPKIEIYGQNEIMDSVNNPELVNGIVMRLLAIDPDITNRINLAYKALEDNADLISEKESKLNEDESKSADLPMLKERLSYYQSAGIDDKLSIIKQITSEESILNSFRESLPPKVFSFPFHKWESRGECVFPEIQTLSYVYDERAQKIQDEYQGLVDWVYGEYEKIRQKWDREKAEKDDAIRASLADISGVHDKSNTEIVEDYTEILRKVVSAEPVQKRIEQNRADIELLYSQRKTLIETCRKAWDVYISHVSSQVKRLNKNKLKGVVRLSIKFKQQKDQLLDRLKKIEGIGDKSIVGISEYDDLDVFDFTDDIRKGSDHLKDKYHLTTSTAERIVKGLSESDLRNIEAYVLPDQHKIELFVNGRFKSMENLSKGQQCTAILHIILLDNRDPLIVDQPEDNLDNSFIAEELISTIRDYKIKRQYIFATHNANIPVFGDAELIVSMEESDGKGMISDGGIGSIDTATVKDQVVKILEGGEIAFKMREEKYGINP